MHLHHIHFHHSRRHGFELDMLNGPVMPKLLTFAVPLILSSVLQLTFNAADVIVVGKFEGDAALAAVPRIAIGSYVGTGSAAQDTNVNVGFAPRAVFLCSNNNGHDAKLVLRGDAWEANAVTMLQLTDTGFRAKYGQYSVETNSNATYYYLAIA